MDIRFTLTLRLKKVRDPNLQTLRMIYCKQAIVATLVLFVVPNLFSQSTKGQLEHQVKFCKTEVLRLESEVTNYKDLLEEQYHRVQELKDTIVTKESERSLLKERISELESASVILLDIARDMEAEGKEVEALKMYKLITEVYPGTLESSSAQFRIKKIYRNLRNKKVDQEN